MLARTRDGNAVKHFKEIIVKMIQEIFSGAFLRTAFAPFCKLLLSITENFINRTGCVELAVYQS